MKTLNIQVMPITELVPYELNSKKHDPAQVKKIAESIKQFGWDQPIVVDADRVIIKGHGRRLAAIELGLKTVPVLVRDDLSPEQVRAARLADNRVAIGDIDTELLRAELSDLDYDLGGIFDDKELDFGLADLGEMNTGAFIDDIDAAVNQQEEATRERIGELERRMIPLYKVLGFREVQGTDEMPLARLMALAERKSGKKGYEAFMDFVRYLTSEDQ